MNAQSLDGQTLLGAAYVMDGRTAPGLLEVWSLLWWTLPLAAALALGVVLVREVRRRDRARHGVAFRLMARSIGLGRSDQKLIGRLAHAGSVVEAGALLLSRGAFDHCAQSYLTTGAGRGWIADSARVVLLRKLLHEA